MESLKLNSKILINFFGKDIVTVEEIKEKVADGLIIDGDGKTIGKKETMLFENDLIAIFQIFPGISEVKLNGIDMTNESISNILKACSALDISFDGSEEYFSKLKDNKLNLSDRTKSALTLDGNDYVSEFDLFESLMALRYAETPQSMIIIDVDDLETVLKYTSISEITIKARTTEDLEKIMSLSDSSNISVNIDISDLKQIKEVPSVFKIDVSIHDMSELSINDIEELEESFNIGNVYIQHTSKEIEDYEFHGKDIYDIETYKKLRQEMDLTINGIDLDSPEIEKFLEIYKRLGNKISYDWEYEDKDTDEENGKYYMEGNPSIHGLIGGLLDNKCVCEGYAKILQQALRCLGLDCRLIRGRVNETKNSDNLHAWNQVKIDGIWYNTDLTWDADKIKEGRELDYCLQSDREFISHYTESKEKQLCNKSYDRNIINKYLGIPFAFTYEDKDYSVTNIIKLAKGLNQYSIKGTRIGINDDFNKRWLFYSLW